MHNLPYSRHAQGVCVWKHLFSSMKVRQAACCVLFSGQDMSLLLIWVKLVVPTAAANDNTATALLTAAQLVHGVNGCRYLNFVMPEASNMMQWLGVDGCSWLMPAMPLILGSCSYCPEQEGPKGKDQRELRGRWTAAAECTWEWNHPVTFLTFLYAYSQTIPCINYVISQCHPASLIAICTWNSKLKVLTPHIWILY